MSRILLVEDDTMIASGILYALETEGYETNQYDEFVKISEEVRQKLCGDSTADDAFAIVTRDIYYSTHKAQ